VTRGEAIEVEEETRSLANELRDLAWEIENWIDQAIDDESDDTDPGDLDQHLSRIEGIPEDIRELLRSK
jgi:hypothetical protein